jgi:hypothetical protein
LRPCAKILVVIFIPHRRQGFLHLTPHPLVTLFRIRVIFLITLLRRKITPLRTVASFSLVLTLEITPLRTAATFSLARSRLIHLLTKPILAVCRTLLFSEVINMLALVEVFFTPLLGEPGEESLRPTLLPADSCRTAGIERNGSAQKSTVCCRVQQTSPRWNIASLTMACLTLQGNSTSPELRGHQGIKLTTGSGTCSDVPTLGLHAARHHPPRDPPRALTSRPLVTIRASSIQTRPCYP